MTWALRNMMDISALLQELECVFYGKISSLDWERKKAEMVRIRNVFCRTGLLGKELWKRLNGFYIPTLTIQA